jgi:UrcA family protein
METNMKTVSTSARVSGGITAAIFGALALCGSSVSVAADGTMPEAVVTYSDLDLSNPQNARELYSRITAAANKVCLSYPVDGRSLAVHAWLRECAHHAVADAVIRIDQPALFAIYNSKNRLPVTNEVATARAR